MTEIYFDPAEGAYRITCRRKGFSSATWRYSHAAALAVFIAWCREGDSTVRITPKA